MALLYSMAASTNLPNFDDFDDGMTDKNSAQHASAYHAHAATIITSGESNLT